MKPGVSKGRPMTADQITSAFRKLALVHHPDKGGNLEKWQELCMARDNAMHDVEAR